MTATKRVCDNDFDSLYTSALLNSAFYRIDVSITLLDARRKLTMVLDMVRLSEPVSLAGKYSTNLLNDANVALEFTDSRVSLVGGCNIQSADYKAFSNGTFSVTQFSSTLRFCDRDNDRVYVGALSQAVNFFRNADGSLTFRRA